MSCNNRACSPALSWDAYERHRARYQGIKKVVSDIDERVVWGDEVSVTRAEWATIKEYLNR